MRADALERLGGTSLAGKTLRVEWARNRDGTGGARVGYLGVNRGPHQQSVVPSGNRIYVGNLAMESTREDVETLFGQFSPLDVRPASG